ncbi:MAG: hypothetical protein Q7R81_06885 [Candidatus Peregrinibacteria bacterium]|nr:hypothetical protein [Candidatus Peregrinibacteria bacterium]
MIARLLLWLILLSTVSPALAADPLPVSEVDTCIDQTNQSLTARWRFYRSVLLGQRKAEDELPSAVRHLPSADEEGTYEAWMKASAQPPGSWVSSTAPGETLIDAQIDARTANQPLSRASAETDPNRDAEWLGIFETPHALTWEFIPMLTQSYRAFRCELESTCKLLQDAHEQEDPPDTLTVQIPGCVPYVMKPLSACVQDELTFGDAEAIYGQCRASAQQLLAREYDLLKFAVSYDAAYRSIVLLGSSLDSFFTDFRKILLGPVQEAIALFGQFNRLPCFAAQCDE